MESFSIFLFILLALLAIVGMVILWAIFTYNRLVKSRNEIKESWAQIDVQLKRRRDLIPNLVETVKGYAAHEKATLQNVIEARNRAAQARGREEQIQAEQSLSSTLGRLMMVVEQYPDLKANQNFLALQEEVSSTENRIGFARQLYNDNVMRFNTQVQSAPSNLIAGTFRFTEEQFFKVEEPSDRQVPAIQF